MQDRDTDNLTEPEKDKSIAIVGNKESGQTDSLSIQSDMVTGVPIVVQGKRIDLDTIIAQGQNTPISKLKVMSAHPNVHPVLHPNAIPLPEQLTVVTPGKNGIPHPRKAPAIGRVVPAVQPKPVAAMPLRAKEEAIANIQHLEIDLGLGSDNVRAIMEDSRGYLWFGTSAGAIRYDGKWMTLYTEKEGMSSNKIRSIVEDNQGNIWFATFGGGVTCYNGSHFIHFTEKEGLSSNYVYSMMEDRKGNLWFGTLNAGLVRYDGTDFTYFTGKEGLSDKSVHTMMEDSKGNLWFGTIAGGACRFDGESFTHFTAKEGLCNNLVYSILEDNQGNIWIGTYKGASRFDGANFTNYTKAEGLIGSFINAIQKDTEGNIWFSNDSGGVASNSGVSRYDGKTFTNFSEKEGLNKGIVWAMTRDGCGNLWCGTSSGVTRFIPNSFTHYMNENGLEHEQMVSSVIEDKRGDLWLGTWGSGLIRFDRDSFTYFTNEAIYYSIINNIIPSKKSNMWFDTGYKGMTDFDGLTFKNYPLLDRGKYSLYPLLQDSRGNLWLSLSGQPIRQDSMGSLLFEDDIIFGNYSVTTLFESKDGQFWFGTDNGGAILYDGKSFIRFDEKQGLSNHWINDILEDRQGNIWFATLGDGLKCYDGTRFTQISEKEGLGSNIVYSMLEDTAGNIWVCRYHGISKLNLKSQKHAPTNDVETTDSKIGSDFDIINYEVADGLPGKIYRSIYLDKKNQLWLGGDKGMTTLDLGKYTLSYNPPKVQIEHIEIMQQFLDFRGLADTSYQNSLAFGKGLRQFADGVVRFQNYPSKLTLPYDLNHLTFYFSATDWQAPHKIQFSFLLENVDKEWSIPQSEPKAEYRNLPSGTHTLLVKSIGAAQIWSNPIEYTFTIRPTWYRSWWAYLLYTLTFGILFLAIRNYELKRQFAKAETRRLHDLDQVKTKLYTNITHEFRTPLTLILGMSERLQGKVDFEAREGLGIIKRNGRQLLNLVNQMLDLAKLESGAMHLNMVQGDVVLFLKYLLEGFQSLAQNKNIQLHFSSEKTSFLLDYDAVRLQQIVSNLLSNAIKFTPPGGEVTLGIGELGNWGIRRDVAAPNSPIPQFLNSPIPQLLISVTDTGPGIPPEQLPRIFDRFYQADDSSTRHAEGTGIGLTLAKELAKLLGGDLGVKSEMGKGTTFTLALPVSNKAAIAPALPLPEKDLTVIAPATMPHLAAPHPSSLIPHPNTILIIEDNADVMAYIREVLKNSYHLLTAANGTLGIEVALREIPDLILSDVMMPGMDGFEVCQQLKKDPTTSHIPIVLLTAKADAASKLQGLEHGAEAYLPKPFDEKELKATLNNLLDNRKKVRRYYTSGEFIAKSARPVSTLSANGPNASEDVFLKEILTMVEAHLDDPELSAEKLAELLNVSYSKLFKKTKALTGMGVTEYIRHIRLHKAAAWLLEYPDQSVTQIALAAGFQHAGFFSREFKKVFGVGPKAYRERGGK